MRGFDAWWPGKFSCRAVPARPGAAGSAVWSVRQDGSTVMSPVMQVCPAALRGQRGEHAVCQDCGQGPCGRSGSRACSMPGFCRLRVRARPIEDSCGASRAKVGAGLRGRNEAAAEGMARFGASRAAAAEYIPAATWMPGCGRRSGWGAFTGPASPALAWPAGRRTPSSLRIWHNRIRRVRKRWCGAWFQAAAGPVPAPDASSVPVLCQAPPLPGWQHLLATPQHAGMCMSADCTPCGVLLHRQQASGRAVSPRTQVSVI